MSEQPWYRPEGVRRELAASCTERFAVRMYIAKRKAGGIGLSATRYGRPTLWLPRRAFIYQGMLEVGAWMEEITCSRSLGESIGFEWLGPASR